MTKENLPFNITFKNTNIENKKFYVLSFEGEEELNDVYKYDLTVLCHEKIDLSEFLVSENKSVVLTWVLDERTRYIHCTCISASIENKVNNLFIYRLKVVAPIGVLDIQKRSRVFLDMNIEDVFSNILREHHFVKGEDYEFDLIEKYEEIDYICQYNESSLRFIRRWMAEYGIRMHFVQNMNGCKIVFSDNNKTFTNLVDEVVEFIPNLNYMTDTFGAVSFAENVKNRVPIKSLYINNDLRYSPVSLNAQGITDFLEDVSDSEYYHFGGTPFIQMNSERYQKVEDDRIKSKTEIINMDTNNHLMSPGYNFVLNNHFYIEKSKKLLILKVKHKGNQLTFLKNLVEPIQQSLLGYNLSEEYTLYENKIETIDNLINFRVTRLADKPTITGIIFGQVYSDGGEWQAYRGTDCTYQIIMPFDMVSDKNKFSCWIKTLGDSLGRGNQITLHHGEAVAIAFIEGDVNRPYIAGAVDQRASLIYDGLEAKLNTGNYEQVVGYNINELYYSEPTSVGQK